MWSLQGGYGSRNHRAHGPGMEGRGVTKDEIIAMAREAGIEVHERKQEARIGSAIFTGSDSTDQLMRFAALVAVKERDACAQVCDQLAANTMAAQVCPSDTLSNVMLRQVAVLGHGECAIAIRARGQKEGA